jgi:hypothetical protein
VTHLVRRSTVLAGTWHPVDVTFILRMDEIAAVATRGLAGAVTVVEGQAPQRRRFGPPTDEPIESSN